MMADNICCVNEEAQGPPSIGVEPPARFRQRGSPAVLAAPRWHPANQVDEGSLLTQTSRLDSVLRHVTPGGCARR